MSQVTQKVEIHPSGTSPNVLLHFSKFCCIMIEPWAGSPPIPRFQRWVEAAMLPHGLRVQRKEVKL
jgi:hypothetical protein